MKRELIIVSTVLIIAGFIWFKYISPARYVANLDGDIIDGSKYVESGEYYFNCNNGVRLKKVPPKLEIGELKEGKFAIASWTYGELKPVLENYTQTPEWEKRL